MNPNTRFLTYSAASPAEDLALEEAIQAGMEAGTSPPTWRIFQSRSPAIVLGTGQTYALEANVDEAKLSKTPILRRHSGGGAVLIGPGVINYSGFFYLEDLPGSQTITGAMQAGLQAVIQALSNIGCAVQMVGQSDLAAVNVHGELQKLSGNSQARKRRSVLIHGTLLAAPDWKLLSRLLKFPSRTPDYRVGRNHRTFLTSLKELNCPSDLKAFTSALSSGMKLTQPYTEQPLPSESAKSSELLKTKYSLDEWNLRR